MIKRLFQTTLAVTLLATGGYANAGYIEIWDGAASNLAEAMAVIAGGHADASAYYGVVDFEDFGDATVGAFGVDNPWPGGYTDFFVARVTGTVLGTDIPFGDFRIEHDDGFAFYVNGVLEAIYDGLTDNIQTYTSVALDPGLNTIEIIFWEWSGGATLELVSRVPNTENGAQLTELGDPVSVPTPTPLALFGAALLGLGFAGRRKESS